MEMIDVLKRLAELDAANPQVVNPMVSNGINQKTQNVVESTADQELEECGPMGSMSYPGQPKTPASINITAGSGEELSHMLKDIMSLAGVGKHDHEPEMGMDVISTEPIGTAMPSSGGDIMRGMLDRMNADSDEDDEDEMESVALDNTPEDPTEPPAVDFDARSHHENQPGAGDTQDGERRSYVQPATFESLMSEYKKFISESMTQEAHWDRYTSNPHLGGASKVRPGEDPNQYSLVDVKTGKKFSKAGETVVFSTRDHARAVAKKLKFGDWEPMPIIRK